ncbi:MAG: DUF2914 domain-containing protein [Rhodothermales bacterium]
MADQRPDQTPDSVPSEIPGRSQSLRAWVTHRPLFRRAAALYEHCKRYAPLLFFVGGVLWDALTLERIDAWVDNALLLVYLVVLGGLILVATLVEHERVATKRIVAYRPWFPHAVQFFLGALFSAHVIFYFQSASLAPSSLFLVVLVVLLVANEFIHQRLFNLYLLCALYFLAVYSFFIFFIPVVTKSMHYGMFLLGGVLSLGLVGGMLGYLRFKAVFAKPRQFGYALGLVGTLFGLVNLFYLLHWIPPVPLAMRFGGAFHHVSRAGSAYELRYERPPRYRFWVDSDEPFRFVEGDTVYCFAAVFAPTRLRTKIYHEWHVYDEAQQEWMATDRIGYDVVGGRNRGYRGYTLKRNTHPGAWRVDVETETGRIIGRIRFDIVPADGAVTDLKRVLYE